MEQHGVNVSVGNVGNSILDNGKPNPTFKLITSVMASVSQMERETLRERQLEGIEAAKRAGTYKGREKGTVESDEEILAKYRRVVKLIKLYPGLSLRKLAGMHNGGLDKKDEVSPNTVKKVLEILNNNNKKRVE